MSRIKIISLCLCIGIYSNLFSQKGKHSAKTISTANTKVNEFTVLTNDALSGNTLLWR